MKKKILLIPTYFPTTFSPIIGSQVQEQTEILSEEFDYKILYCLPGIGWKRFVVYKIIQAFTLKPLYKSCENLLIKKKLDTKGVFYFQSHYLPDKINLILQKNAYNYLLKKLIESDWKPELIHARGANFAGIIAAFLSKKYKIPFIITENVALLIDNSSSKYILKKYKSALENSSLNLFVSNFLLKLTLMHGIALQNKYIVVGNMIDDKKFILNDKIISNKKFTIFTTGYNAYIKDYNTFFKAINHIINLGHTDIIVKIGVTYSWSKNNKEELYQLAKKNGVFDFCEFHFEITRDEMIMHFQQSDVYVSTSIIETFGIASCEAMFCGIPVVSTSNGGIDDFMTPFNGIKVEIMDYEAVSKAILNIKEKKIVFNPIQIRESVLDKFGIQFFSEKIKTAYSQVIQ